MAVDYHLKIDTIEGESQDRKHKNWMELKGWNWGESNDGSSSVGSGAGSGKVAMQDFQFVIQCGISSPKLFLACATGEHFPRAVLHASKAGGQQETFVEWKFGDILISSYQTGGQGDSDALPTDRISFNFTKIEMEYWPQTRSGSRGAGVKAGYDLKKGQKV
ncbi:type VI secretion protein [Bryobacterales bacterium F-183]|nr:type VI secretion protein [Bryobacterales bacterium F-183]